MSEANWQEVPTDLISLGDKVELHGISAANDGVVGIKATAGIKAVNAITVPTDLLRPSFRAMEHPTPVERHSLKFLDVWTLYEAGFP